MPHQPATTRSRHIHHPKQSNPADQQLSTVLLGIRRIFGNLLTTEDIEQLKETMQMKKKDQHLIYTTIINYLTKNPSIKLPYPVNHETLQDFCTILKSASEGSDISKCL